MGFVNEFIAPEDFEARNLKEIDRKFIVGGTNARDWTIDRDRGIYLRNVAIGREEFRSHTMWLFFWEEHLFTLELHLIEGSGGRGEPGWSHWKLMLVAGAGVPGNLEGRQSEFLADLEAALVVYGGFGIYSAGVYTSYSVTLDIDERCMSSLFRSPASVQREN